MPIEPAGGRWGWMLLLALALFIVPRVAANYTPNTWLVGDGGFYLNIQKSITADFTLDQTEEHPRSWYEGTRTIDDAFSNISLGRNGEWWPKHSYLMPIAALPLYWLFDVPGTLVFNVSMMLLMLLLGYRLACEVAPDGHAATAALVCGLTGPFVVYSYNFSNDGFYTALAMSGLLAILRRRPALGGLLFGLGIWAKVTCVLLAPVVLAALIWRRYDLKSVRRFVAGASVPLMGLALANTYMFGAPWTTSYHRVLIVRDGVQTIASHTNLFEVPLVEGLKHMFNAHRHGLASAWPASLVACLGLIPMWRHRRAMAVGIAVTSVLLMCFYAKFNYYQERFLFPWFVLGIVPGAVLLEWASRRAASLTVPAELRVAVTVGVVGALALVRLTVGALSSDSWNMASYLEDAEVYLGDRHCDYFNNMRWSWECMGADRNALDFVGINEAQTHKFGDVEAHGMLFVGGHSSRRPRRIVFHDVPVTNVLRVRYGLDAASKQPADTEIRFRVGGERVWRHKMDTPGTLYEKALDTSRWAGSRVKVEVVVRTRHRRNSRLVFDGRVE